MRGRRRKPGTTEDQEAAVLKSAMLGNRVALDEVWASNRAWVAAIVESSRPREVELEDLLQDVALRFVRQVARLRDAERLRPWLRQIAKNVCTDAARRATLRRTEDQDFECIPIESGRPGTTADIEARDELERTRAALASLPEDMREVLALKAIEGMTQREIATTLSLPETTIETRLVRARRALRAALMEAATQESSAPRRCLQ